MDEILEIKDNEKDENSAFVSNVSSDFDMNGGLATLEKIKALQNSQTQAPQVDTSKMPLLEKMAYEGKFGLAEALVLSQAGMNGAIIDNYLNQSRAKNVNLGANVRSISATASTDEAANTAKGLDTIQRYMQGANEASGFWNGVDRKLQDFTGGAFDLSNERNQQFRNEINELVVLNAALDRGDGKRPTNEEVRKSDADLNKNFASKKTNIKNAKAVLNKWLNHSQNALNLALEKNAPINSILLDRYAKGLKMREYLDSLSSVDDFSYDDMQEFISGKARAENSGMQSFKGDEKA